MMATGSRRARTAIRSGRWPSSSKRSTRATGGGRSQETARATIITRSIAPPDPAPARLRLILLTIVDGWGWCRLRPSAIASMPTRWLRDGCEMAARWLRDGCERVARVLYTRRRVKERRVCASTRVISPAPGAPQRERPRPRRRAVSAWLVGHPVSEAELHHNSFDLLRLVFALLVIVSHAYPLSGHSASEP